MSSDGHKIEEDRMSMISQFSTAVAAMPKKDITEIKSFANPPVAVIDVVTGIVILLGHKGDLRWSNVKAICGKADFTKSIQDCDVRSISPETRRKAMELLSKYSKDQVKAVNLATATLFEWAVAVAEQ